LLIFDVVQYFPDDTMGISSQQLEDLLVTIVEADWEAQEAPEAPN